jgi:TolA-binding protein
MSEPTKLPDLEPESLRDHGSSAAIERIWQRLDGELGQGRHPSRTMMWWAPAAVIIVFGCGVFVGARWTEREEVAPTALAPEPQVRQEPGSATESPPPVPAQQRVAAPRSKRGVSSPLQAEAGRALAGRAAPQPSARTAAQPPVAAVPMEWERLANVAEYAAAWRALQDAGGFEGVLSRATAEQAMLLHDIARFSGQRQRAIQALRHVVNEHPGDPYAPTAAYTLGNMLDNAGDQSGAAEAFEIYRRLAPKGDFVEDALTRQLDVAIQQRDAELARRLADQYANEFPNGRRLGEMRRRVAQLIGNGKAAGSPAPDAHAAPEDRPSEEAPEDEPGARGAAP